MANAIEVSGLTKSFGSKRAVDEIAFDVAKGSIFGFVGPNGAGKTTTIRMLLGLARADAGSVRILDEHVPSGLPRIMRQVGALVEGPGFYPGMSAQKNLRALALTAGDSAALARIGTLLAVVGLAGVDKQVGAFSQGMKQRLALAAALLHAPTVLVLDEPTTGLDPVGIRTFRELILDFRAQGKTVFFSSHQLSEVEQICDAVCFVHAGKVVASGSMAEIRAKGAVQVRIEDAEAAERALEAKGWKTKPKGQWIEVLGASSRAVNQALLEAGLVADEVTAGTGALESLFMELEARAASQPSVEDM